MLYRSTYIAYQVLTLYMMAYTLFQNYTSNSLGVFTITTSLDISLYDFQIVISGLTINNPTTTDANIFNSKVLSQSFVSKDYYRMNTNSNADLSITDVYLIHKKINGIPVADYNTPNPMTSDHTCSGVCC